MGVYFDLYVVPEAEYMEFLPDARVMNSVIDVLFNLEWAARQDTYRVDVGQVRADGRGEMNRVEMRHTGRLPTLQKLVHGGRAFVVRMAGLPEEHFWPAGEVRKDGLSRKYDLEEDESGVFGPRYCDELAIVWSPLLVAVREDAYSGTPVPCPTCGTDVQVEVEESKPALVALSSAAITHYPPPECPACGMVLNLADLVAMSGEVSSYAPERAPFARLIVVVHPPAKATPVARPMAAAPDLLAALHETTGVPFRSFGRYS